MAWWSHTCRHLSEVLKLLLVCMFIKCQLCLDCKIQQDKARQRGAGFLARRSPSRLRSHSFLQRCSFSLLPAFQEASSFSTGFGITWETTPNTIKLVKKLGGRESRGGKSSNVRMKSHAQVMAPQPKEGQSRPCSPAPLGCLPQATPPFGYHMPFSGSRHKVTTSWGGMAQPLSSPAGVWGTETLDPKL